VIGMTKLRNMLKIGIVVAVMLSLSGCSTVHPKIGLLKSRVIPSEKLSVGAVPQTLLKGEEGTAVFTEDGLHGVYVSHSIPSGTRLEVTSVYGEPDTIVVDVSEVSVSGSSPDSKSTLFQTPTDRTGAHRATLAALLPNAPEWDSRRIEVNYNLYGALYVGKNLRIVEAICHPSVAYSGVRYYFAPVDTKNTDVLYVDKGPTALSDKVAGINLKNMDSVMVTYVIPPKPTDPAQIVDVVRTPKIGLPGGPE